jgi:hypothetical protein
MLWMLSKVAIEFDVPKTTLHDTLKEKYQDAGMPLLLASLVFESKDPDVFS